MPTEVLPTYLGNVNIEETDRSDINADVYGLDTFTANFKGSKAKFKVDRIIAKLKAGATHRDLVPDSPYTQFSVKSYTLSTDRSYASFAVQFVGKIDGKEPPPQEEHSLVKRTAEIEVDDTPAIEIYYLAPMRKHTYVTRTFPDTPRFSGSGLFRYRLQVLEMRLIVDLPRTFFTHLKFDQISVMEEPKAKQAGQWWECEEEWVARLRPYSDLPRQNYPTRV